MAVSLPAGSSIEHLLRLETFAPHVGGEFEVQRGSEWVALKLVEADARGRRGEGEKFSLLFAAGPEKPLVQGIHSFRHPALGAFELFITPVVSTQREARMYEAVINREVGL